MINIVGGDILTLISLYEGLIDDLSEILIY